MREGLVFFAGLAAWMLPAAMGRPAAAATLDVTRFGAVANDPLDDGAAIQAAINASVPGDVVLLPAGTFLIFGTIQPKPSMTLSGAGRGRTRLRYAGASPGNFISLNAGVSSVEIRHLTLDGAGNPAALNGITATGGRGHFIHHIGVENLVDSGNYGPHGILFSGVPGNPPTDGVTDSVISDSFFTHIGTRSAAGTAIRISHGSSRIQVLRNSITNTGRGGILSNDHVTDMVVRNNTIAGSGLRAEKLGIEMWNGCHRALIEDNVVDHWISLDRSSMSAVRRNTVASRATYAHTALEMAGGSDCVFTDNVVEDGQNLGISVSNVSPTQYGYWGRNTIGRMAQWGAQLMGEGAGIRYLYFYANKFLRTPRGHPAAPYPNDSGHGFRFLGTAAGTLEHITLEANEIRANGGVGIQFSGVDRVAVIGNIIKDNAGAAATPYPGAHLLWSGNTVRGNGDNAQPAPTGFPGQGPTASFSVPGGIRAGRPVAFTDASTDPDGQIAHRLWDFGDGLPSTAVNPTHVYPARGAYRATLLVWDDSGRAARFEKKITVAP